MSQSNNVCLDVQSYLFDLQAFDECATLDRSETQVCVKCRIQKPLSYFRARQRSESGETKRFLSCCKACEKRISKVVADIKKAAPPKPDFCDCCGERVEKEKLRLDHCHETDKFRGWLCTNCNVGISRLGDNKTGVAKALDYLNKL